MTSEPLRLGFVGIHAGRRRDQAVSQDEILAAALGRAGHRVRTASTVRHPVLRTAHHVVAILSWARRVDVVIVAVFSGRSFFMAELATVLCRLFGVPTVVVLHGGRLPAFAARHPHRVARTLRGSAAVVAPSPFLAEALEGFGRSIEVVPNMVDLRWVEPRTRERPAATMLWMRTFHEHYDPLTAVAAFGLIAARHPDARLTMAGADQGWRPRVEDEIRARGLTGRVALPGYLDGEAKRRAFAEHDIFLNTNIVDNTPVTVIEACAHGLVVVATAVGGIPSLLSDGVDAVLVPVGDAEAIASAVDGLLAEPERAARLSERAQQHAARSGWASVGPRWEAVLRGVVRSAPSRASSGGAARR